MSRIRAPSHADSSQLIERYNADRFAKVESKALLLVDQHPDYGLVGLAIIIAVYRNRRSVIVEDVDIMKW